MRISPSLIRVLAVPRGTPSCSATSTWVRPPKKASSSASRWASLNSVNAVRARSRSSESTTASTGFSGVPARAAECDALTVAPRLLGPHAVDRTPASDRHGPAMHPTASRVEAGCVAPHLDEHLLRDLLGLGGIAYDAQHGAVERGRQLVVEVGERVLVAVGDPSHQRIPVSNHPRHVGTVRIGCDGRISSC